jgi:hypothetical protein
LILSADPKEGCPVPKSPQIPSIDLQEVNRRNRNARAILTGLSAGSPTLAHYWSTIESALADGIALSTEVAQLRSALIRARRHHADLAAAARATLAADDEEESDPLSYVRDELRAQGWRT